MRKAIDLGVEHESVGALVTRDGEILAQSTGAIFTRPDATAHSEIEAIRDACEAVQSATLAGSWLYTTHEPCPMCMAACCWSQLDGVVYAATDEDMPEEWGTIFESMSADEVRDGSAHNPEIIEEYIRKEATKIHDVRD